MQMYKTTVADVTFFPLSTYYVGFIIFVCLHCILVFAIKHFFSPSFKR